MIKIDPLVAKYQGWCKFSSQPGIRLQGESRIGSYHLMYWKAQHDWAIEVLGNEAVFLQEKGEGDRQSPAPPLLLKQSPIFIVAGNYEEIPDFRTHCHEQNTAILGIHKNENEASTFRAYETRFHIAKINPFPLKSIYLTCAPDKRNRIHSGHTGSFAFLFLF